MPLEIASEISENEFFADTPGRQIRFFPVPPDEKQHKTSEKFIFYHISEQRICGNCLLRHYPITAIV